MTMMLVLAPCEAHEACRQRMLAVTCRGQAVVKMLAT